MNTVKINLSFRPSFCLPFRERQARAKRAAWEWGEEVEREGKADEGLIQIVVKLPAKRPDSGLNADWQRNKGDQNNTT